MIEVLTIAVESSPALLTLAVVSLAREPSAAVRQGAADCDKSNVGGKRARRAIHSSLEASEVTYEAWSNPPRQSPADKCTAHCNRCIHLHPNIRHCQLAPRPPSRTPAKLATPTEPPPPPRPRDSPLFKHAKLGNTQLNGLQGGHSSLGSANKPAPPSARFGLVPPGSIPGPPPPPPPAPPAEPSLWPTKLAPGKGESDSRRALLGCVKGYLGSGTVLARAREARSAREAGRGRRMGGSGRERGGAWPEGGGTGGRRVDETGWSGNGSATLL